MFSSNSTDPCSSYFSSSAGATTTTPANCYRPLQQLYKTVYSSSYQNTSTPKNIACICRPAERYKTTNMTYGSFYYDNFLSTEKNQVINYDKAIFARCYDQNKINKGYTSKDKNCDKNGTIFSHASDPDEYQYWVQPTSPACCPIDCCHNTTIICPSTSTNNDKSSNLELRCV